MRKLCVVHASARAQERKSFIVISHEKDRNLQGLQGALNFHFHEMHIFDATCQNIPHMCVVRILHKMLSEL